MGKSLYDYDINDLYAYNKENKKIQIFIKNYKNIVYY
jgi:hypothetical protein